MTRNGWNVADCDMHVFEPADLWQRYIDPAYRHVAPIGLTEMPRDIRVKVKSHVILRMGAVRPAGPGPWKAHYEDAYSAAAARNWDPASQLEAMDREGLDRAVLFPTRGLFVLALDTPQMLGADGLEPEFAAAIARAYNDWMRDFCQADPHRLLGAGLIAPHCSEAAVEEVRRCAGMGFKTVMLSPGCVNRRPWYDRAYDPIWAECEKQNIPVSFHGGGQNYLKPDFSLEVLDKFMLWHSFNQPLGIMFVAACFTAGGVLERFPKLRVGLLEGNCSWAPFLFYRLDEHWEWLAPMEAPDLPKKPSEYLKTNCFLSVEADEETARQYVEVFGDDNLVFSTDYPHADSKFPHAVDTFLKLPLSDATKRKVLWDNWCRLYAA